MRKCSQHLCHVLTCLRALPLANVGLQGRSVDTSKGLQEQKRFEPSERSKAIPSFRPFNMKDIRGPEAGQQPVALRLSPHHPSCQARRAPTSKFNEIKKELREIEGLLGRKSHQIGMIGSD